MHGPLVLCLMLSLALVGATNAAGPDEPDQAPALVTPDSVLASQPELQPDTATAPTPSEFVGNDASCPCTENACCCGQLVGKFRCLWDTYCADRRECWRKACGQGTCGPGICGRSHCGTCCGKPSRALFVVGGAPCVIRKGHLHRAGCRISNCDGCCGGAVGTFGAVEEAAPLENGAPTEPTPAGAGAPTEAAPNSPQPEESLQPTPPAASETPATLDTKSASSRRTWWLKRNNNIPR